MHKLKARAVSFLTAILLVFTLLPLLPEGIMTAQAYERRFSFLDENGLEWKFTLEDGGSGAAHIISVKDTLGKDDDNDESNDKTQITVPEKVTDNVYGYTHYVTNIECELEGTSFTPTFAKFTKLKRVELPKALKVIGQRTFYEHETLEEIYIHTGVTMIGAQAFYGCKKLKAVHIPASVTAIKDYAFDECTSLSRIYIPKTVAEIGDHSFERIADNATIYGYTGTKAEEYATKWNKNFQPLDAIIDAVPYYIPAFSGSITYTQRSNGKAVPSYDGIPLEKMNNVDKSKDATLAADEAPDGMTFEGYEIKYDISFKDNNNSSTQTAYRETFTQTPEENTFSFHLPDEAYEKMFGYIVLWISNKPRYNFGGTVTITPIYKKIPHTLKIENGTATLDPSRGSYTQITAAEGDLVYLYGKKPDDGNYYFIGWTLDGEDIELQSPDSSWTTFTMPARDVTLTCNFTKGQKYGLYVDSVQVTTENAKDVLGNGAFTFNEKTKTLYINEDYTTDKGTLISCNYSFKDTLTITPKKDVTLSAKTDVIRMGGINGIITGEHKLKMNNTDYGIYLEDSDFRIINANVEIDVRYQGIGGYSSSSNYLTVSNSNVSVKTEKGEEVSTTAGTYVDGAVCNMNKGLTLTNETITAPENWEEIKKSAHSFIKDISNGKPAKEVVFAPVAHTHTLQKHAAKAGSCLENGNTVYWECSDCGQYFKDKDGKIPVAKDSWVIERTGHKLTWNPAKNANCTEDGHKGAYDCSICGKHFNSSDKFTENETQDWLRPKTGHSFSQSYHTSAKQPTFYDKGNVEYWRCTRCYKYFSDDQGTNQLDENSLEIPVLEPKDLGTLTLDFTKGDFKFKNAAQRDRIYKMLYIVNWGHNNGHGVYINQRVRLDGPQSGYKVNVDDEHSTGTDQNYDIILKDDQSGFTLLESRNLSNTTHTLDLNKDAAEFRAICDYIYQETKTNGCYSKVKFIFPEKHVHTLERVDRKEPSCTEGGNWIYFVCTGCGKAFIDSAGTKPTTAESQIRKALGHNYVKTVVKPTCKAQGYTLHKCSRCEDYYKDTYTAKTAHKWSDWTTSKAATCTDDGEQTRTCSVCKKTQTKTISKLGHDYVETVVKPTCKAQGYTLHKCSRCEDYYKDTYTAKTAHKWSEWTTSKAATCTDDGEQTRTCSVCKKTQTKTLTKLGHNYADTVVKPTCTKRGYTLHKCSRCGDSYKDNYTDTVDHKWSDWKTTKEATETATGVRERTCSVCKKTETESIPTKAHTHKFTVTKVVAPTCTEKGYTLYTCTCGETKKDDYTNATGHSYGSPKFAWSSDNSSCKVTFTCSNDKSHTKSVTASVTKNETAASCTAQGSIVYTATAKLNGKTYTDKKTVKTAAADHKWSAWKTTGFNFSKNTSTQTRTCAVCGKTEKQTVQNAIDRLAGANRYDSAAVISQAMYKTSDTVIVATGLTFNDALVAVPLASAYNVPLLLATEKHITAQTEAELKRLNAKNVIVVSTNGAIGEKAKAEFKAANYNMTYIKGKTCFETAAKVAKALQDKTKKVPDTIFFATDSAFADALSASPVAAIKNAPIMYLKNTGSIDKATADYLKSVKGKVKNAYIIGGDGVISNAMMKNVAKALGLTVNKTVVRVAGKNRYETCVAVNKKFKSVLTGTGICVAKGLDFPDALAGGVYAASTKQALFLADGKKLQDCQNTYLKGKNAGKITVFGGTGAVPDELVKLIAKASV